MPRAAATKMSLDASVVAFVSLETRQAAAACKLAGVQLIATPQHVVCSVHQAVMQQSCCLTYILLKHLCACACSDVDNAAHQHFLAAQCLHSAFACLFPVAIGLS